MSEGVENGHVLGVKVAVVEVDALGEVAVAGLAYRDGVVGFVLDEGVGEFAGGVDFAVEDVCDGVAGLFAEETGVENTVYWKKK